MGLLEFMVALSAIAVPVLFGAGAVMITPPHAEYRAARACFWLSASLAILLVAMWGAQTPLPMWVRVSFVALGGAVITLILMVGLNSIRSRERVESHQTTLLSRPIAYEPAGVSLNNGFVSAFKFGVKNNASTLVSVNVVMAELRVDGKVFGRIRGGRPAIIGQAQTAFWQIVPGDGHIEVAEPQSNISSSVSGTFGPDTPRPIVSSSGEAIIEIEYDDVPARGLRHSRITYEFPPGVGGYSTKVIEQREY